MLTICRRLTDLGSEIPNNSIILNCASKSFSKVARGMYALAEINREIQVVCVCLLWHKARKAEVFSTT